MIKGSLNNKVYNNCFKENNYGAYVCCGSSDNSIYNNIFNNVVQVIIPFIITFLTTIQLVIVIKMKML